MTKTSKSDKPNPYIQRLLDPFESDLILKQPTHDINMATAIFLYAQDLLKLDPKQFWLRFGILVTKQSHLVLSLFNCTPKRYRQIQYELKVIDDLMYYTGHRVSSLFGMNFNDVSISFEPIWRKDIEL